VTDQPTRVAIPMVRCAECGAVGDSTAETCWLCQATLAAREEIVTAEMVQDPQHRHGSETLMAVTAIIVAVSMVLLAIGLGVTEMKLLIPFVLVATPATIAVLTHLRSADQRSQELGAVQVLAKVAVSVVCIIGGACLAGLALLFALFVVCMVAFNMA
jgi:hypothetical protein